MTARAHDRAQGSPLRQRMIEQMRIANLAESTQYSYLYEIERLAGHYKASSADLDAEQLRAWVPTLIDRGLGPATTNATLSALRFLYVETLGCPERVAGLRNRKRLHMLPRHMTEQEVERPILATPDLRHRAAFVTAYAAGLRVSETVAVKVGDIKSDRKCLHVPSGKGGAERMAPLPDGVIDYLRGYWKNIWPQPASWLFYGASPDKLLSPLRIRSTRRDGASPKYSISPSLAVSPVRASWRRFMRKNGISRRPACRRPKSSSAPPSFSRPGDRRRRTTCVSNMSCDRGTSAKGAALSRMKISPRDTGSLPPA